jgi:DNA-binding CsgD family transcriptional regulator
MGAFPANPRAGETAGARHAPYCRLGAAMFSDPVWEEIARRLRLSRQELQIVRGVFDRRKESAIATKLGISPHTVHTHFERLHHKLAVADRVELVLRIMNEFLLVTASPESNLPSVCPHRTAGRCPMQAG